MKQTEITVSQKPKTRCGNPYETCRNETLGPFFRNWPSELTKKHYLEKLFATRFQNVGKPYKTNGNMVSQNAKRKGVAKHL